LNLQFYKMSNIIQKYDKTNFASLNSVELGDIMSEVIDIREDRQKALVLISLLSNRKNVDLLSKFSEQITDLVNAINNENQFQGKPQTEEVIVESEMGKKICSNLHMIQKIDCKLNNVNLATKNFNTDSKEKLRSKALIFLKFPSIIENVFQASEEKYATAYEVNGLKIGALKREVERPKKTKVPVKVEKPNRAPRKQTNVKKILLRDLKPEEKWGDEKDEDL
jgi:hypothetical protein